MNTAKKLTIRKLFYNKKFAISFSLIVAFIFWLTISIDQNPERDRTFNNLPITVNTQGTVMEDLGIDIISDITDKNVSVTVYGPNYIVSSLSSEDIIVTASVSEVTTPGTYDLNLTANYNSSEDAYSFSNISPSTIRVTCDYIDTKDFTVIPKADGVSAVSGLVAEAPIVSIADSATVTIKGPRTEMEKIASVVAVSEEKVTLEATTNFEADIMLLDEAGNEIDKTLFTLSAEKITISVPISKRAEFKVTPTFKNFAAGSINSIIKYSLSDTTVAVIGPPDTIDSMSEVTLEEIDVREISTTNNEFVKNFILPDGVKLLDNITSVTVTIDTDSFGEKTVTVNNVKFENLSQDVQVSDYSSIKNVKICGPKAAIKNISASDIIATADLAGKTAGEYSVEISIKSDKYPSVWQVGSYTVSVTIK